MDEVKFNDADITKNKQGYWLSLKLIGNHIQKAKDFVNTISVVNTNKLETDKKVYIAELKQFRNKRSITANAYSWILTDKLANELTIRGAVYTKDDIHREMIFKYGQKQYEDDGQLTKISIMEKIKDVNKFAPYAKQIGQGQVNGITFNHYAIYKGSSEYNSKEMAIFIEGIISDCKELGIDTKTPNEIANMLSLMGEV